MRILTISGKAQHGKDTFANSMKKILEGYGHKVLITHYGDLLKYTCRTFFNWDGKKDEHGRSILQKIGTDEVRSKYPNFWVDYIAKILDVFNGEWDYALIPDTRFPGEIETLRNEFGDDVITIKIERPNFDNGLTEEQKKHPSETSLDKYEFSYNIKNDGSLDDLNIKVVNCLNAIMGCENV